LSFGVSELGTIVAEPWADWALIEPAELVARLDRVTLDEVRAVGSRMLAGPRAVASVGAKLALAA